MSIRASSTTCVTASVRGSGCFGPTPGGGGGSTVIRSGKGLRGSGGFVAPVVGPKRNEHPFERRLRRSHTPKRVRDRGAHAFGERSSGVVHVRDHCRLRARCVMWTSAI